jgi:hypothetical protein
MTLHSTPQVNDTPLRPVRIGFVDNPGSHDTGPTLTFCTVRYLLVASGPPEKKLQEWVIT